MGDRGQVEREGEREGDTGEREGRKRKEKRGREIIIITVLV